MAPTSGHRERDGCCICASRDGIRTAAAERGVSCCGHEEGDDATGARGDRRLGVRFNGGQWPSRSPLQQDAGTERSGHMMVGITSIQRNRCPYIVEWIAFHLLVGFDRI